MRMINNFDCAGKYFFEGVCKNYDTARKTALFEVKTVYDIFDAIDINNANYTLTSVDSMFWDDDEGKMHLFSKRAHFVCLLSFGKTRVNVSSCF